MKSNLKRRDVLRAAGSGIIATTLLPTGAWADVPAMEAKIKSMFGDTPIRSGRLRLTIPKLSESGYFVPIDVEAESTMTSEDYVKRISIFSDRNPIPLIATYNFTPHSGRARAAGKIRLGGTQNVHAFAEMSDGALFSTSMKVFVTLAACVVN